RTACLFCLSLIPFFFLVNSFWYCLLLIFPSVRLTFSFFSARTYCLFSLIRLTGYPAVLIMERASFASSPPSTCVRTALPPFCTPFLTIPDFPDCIFGVSEKDCICLLLWN